MLPVPSSGTFYLPSSCSAVAVPRTAHLRTTTTNWYDCWCRCWRRIFACCSTVALLPLRRLLADSCCGFAAVTMGPACRADCCRLTALAAGSYRPCRCCGPRGWFCLAFLAGLVAQFALPDAAFSAVHSAHLPTWTVVVFVFYLPPIPVDLLLNPALVHFGVPFTTFCCGSTTDVAYLVRTGVLPCCPFALCRTWCC